jgi:DNA primase
VTELYDVQAIRAAHPIVETVLSAGIELRRSGRRLIGRCPFHEDREPSLVIYPQTASYFCFGCDAGGDVIDFVGRIRGSAFRETAALLAGSGQTSSQPSATVPVPARRVVRSIGEEELAVIEAAASLYTRQLIRSRRARSYLAGRGLDDATVSRLRVGHADGGLARHLRERRLSLGAAQRLGLLSGERDTLQDRIVVPDLDANGRATWLTARSLDGREPRYLNLRLPSPLLGLARVRAVQVRAVVVTEGPFDWLTACAWELRAVALLGTHLSRAALGALRSFRRVYLALDADGPGRRATDRLVSELGTQAIVVPLPPGVHDLNELGCRPAGREGFLRSLTNARTRMEESWPNTTNPDRHDRAA